MSNQEGLEAAQRNTLSAIRSHLGEEQNFPGFTQEDKEANHVMIKRRVQKYEEDINSLYIEQKQYIYILKEIKSILEQFVEQNKERTKEEKRLGTPRSQIIKTERS